MTQSTIPMNGLFSCEYFDIESKHTKGILRIFVGKPPGFDSNARYPVIYTLDGNASFASLTGTQRMLTQGGEMPPSFVIGIGYPGETLWESMARRNRDYAPSDPGEAEIRALGATEKAGGADFLRFLQEELKPLIERRYPVDPKNSTLQGVSLGGLFGVWVLLTEPGAFQNYILGSPAIWWRQEEFWQWEQSYADCHKDLPASVFVGAGALENKDSLRADALKIAEKNIVLREQVEQVISWNDEHGWPEVADLVPRLVNQLRQRSFPGLRIHSHIFPDESHMSVPAAISSRGLRYVFGSWVPCADLTTRCGRA
ncbi:alpha/beta hydrolase [Pseudohongiella spirulinae]|uniref:Esterase n=1 Tax=Pseudohongiella spirulinae TaxID=1249552 RepID=A0A0S2KAY1_9GAMM|nr:alpha/beta hydrolase-fold protein [Pseudohongiella spirulinae]ALO45504.1 hypothetical protein PS2015_830 [Pseudohongiella spirulinae]